MERRSFLRGLGGLSLGLLAGGCQGITPTGLTIHGLKGSLPAQLLRRFRQASGQNLSYQVHLTPADLFALLADDLGDNSLVSLGQAWLDGAIAPGKIQPMAKSALPSLEDLDPRWQSLIETPPLPTDTVWGIPYRWGATVMVYRRDRFAELGWTPTDWSDLWRSDLQGKFSLLNDPREVIGLTLKHLGHSYNSDRPQDIPPLLANLQSLRQGCKLFSSDAYLQPLVLGDTWLAVGWSSDVLPLLKRDDTLGAVMPKSGTALWTDIWVQPQSGENQPLDLDQQAWLNFWLEPEVARLLSQFSDGVSPLILSSEDIELPSPAETLLLTDGPALAASEFILPQAPEVAAQYQKIWTETILRWDGTADST
ncbi:extracellular solute-binding protein [Candidatus Synechococcus calcipolaris G9]|uniref:Extracellular solute-binding protein n=1 Tax=Candidatus Synechococcus calcipolaris G9 TaxID=1497997 RepID=A0ABT6EZS6_9SYNE|nr:extracellular solute-binding protein [Candidatus Synechococcus calcipolaris]MDG2991101.1 extracellular solute-binding protein [Candidatus Synechococcus calcipolaris G9]